MATFQTQGYPVNPAGFNFDYRTPPVTPAAGKYYSPRHFVHASPPARGHSRRATGDGQTYTYVYTQTPTPRKPAYYSTPDPIYTSAQSIPQRRTDYVSGFERRRESTRYDREAHGSGERKHFSSSKKQQSSGRSKYYVPPEDVYNDRSYEHLPRYEQCEPLPPPYTKRRAQPHIYIPEQRADHRSSDQVPIYTHADPQPIPQPSRTRRASHTNTPKPAPPQQPRRPTTASKPPPPTATDADRRSAGIPAGYSYKNWDPTEEPILLLGSVFDANSLGKWIYDWTVFFYGPATPMAEVAGELWLLLIQLAHKVKRGEDVLPRIRITANRDMVEDFLESGERLWQRFNKLLKICEGFMWKAAKKEGRSGATGGVTMGKNSGCEFVDAIFGRDRELERTERLMTGIRLWSMRFDANCEEILRDPAA